MRVTGHDLEQRRPRSPSRRPSRRRSPRCPACPDRARGVLVVRQRHRARRRAVVAAVSAGRALDLVQLVSSSSRALGGTSSPASRAASRSASSSAYFASTPSIAYSLDTNSARMPMTSASNSATTPRTIGMRAQRCRDAEGGELAVLHGDGCRRSGGPRRPTSAGRASSRRPSRPGRRPRPAALPAAGAGSRDAATRRGCGGSSGGALVGRVRRSTIARAHRRDATPTCQRPGHRLTRKLRRRRASAGQQRLASDAPRSTTCASSAPSSALSARSSAGRAIGQLVALATARLVALLRARRGSRARPGSQGAHR